MRTRGLAIALATLPFLALFACTTPPPITVTLTPSEATLAPDQTQDFTATVTGTANTAVTWSTTGGTIAGSGNTITYTAPNVLGDYALTATSTADPTKNASAAARIVAHPAQLWALQFGTGIETYATAVAIDGSDHVLVAGYTHGGLFGPHQGDIDAFVAKYAPNGELLWARQFGTANTDRATAVAVDGSENVLVAGYTYGSLFDPHQGDSDAFVLKLTADGADVWDQQHGTSRNDRARGIAVDGSDHVIIVGYTYGSLFDHNVGNAAVFALKLTPGGTTVWTQQHGTSSSDFATTVATDDNDHVVVAGYTRGDLCGPNQGGYDAFVVKLASSGTDVWNQQRGTGSDDHAVTVATDGSDNVLVAGYTYGSLFGPNPGNADTFLVKLDPNGFGLWTRQLGTGEMDAAQAVAVDGSGRVLLAGSTAGSLFGPSRGGDDAFLTVLASDGTDLFADQFGSTSDDTVAGIAVDSHDHVVLVGDTAGSLAGPRQGAVDAFIIKLAP